MPDTVFFDGSRDTSGVLEWHKFSNSGRQWAGKGKYCLEPPCLPDGWVACGLLEWVHIISSGRLLMCLHSFLENVHLFNKCFKATTSLVSP